MVNCSLLYGQLLHSILQLVVILHMDSCYPPYHWLSSTLWPVVLHSMDGSLSHFGQLLSSTLQLIFLHPAAS